MATTHIYGLPPALTHSTPSLLSVQVQDFLLILSLATPHRLFGLHLYQYAGEAGTAHRDPGDGHLDASV